MRYFIPLVLTMASPLSLACNGGVSADPVAGKELATRFKCASCHGTDLSGVDWPAAGTFIYASNLTPDRETGLGTWTDDEITSAIRDGADDDAALCALMPRFALSDTHASSLVAYLRSIPPVLHDIPASDCTTAPTSDIDDASVGDAGIIVETN